MKKLRLSVVAKEDALRGIGPSSFEQLARSCVPKSADHIGLVMIASTLAAHAASTCVAPSGQGELLSGIGVALRWVRGHASAQDVTSARVRCFGAVSAIERLTADAVRSAQDRLPSSTETPLDPHANHVVSRYARLSAHFAVSAVCHALDSVATPEAALQVLGDVEGARAYQATGLGSARHAAFRKAAFDQAEWEAERQGSASSDAAFALGVQVFHEYLGGRWRVHADAERAKTTDFIHWALSGRA